MLNTAGRTEKTLEELQIKFVEERDSIKEYRLNNDLKVLLVENHTGPVVTLLVLYKVGSRNEGVGYTGATHFLEHMLFKGTKKHNPDKGNGIDDLLTQIGAYWNATTWFDRTSYFEVVPSEFLELCVSLEADRMRNLLLRQKDRDSEMSVVRNELERGENYPEEALEKELYAVAFREHPYHHPTIGWRSDVEGVALERLRAFYDTFYWPNNTTVVLLGDFENDNALRVINKHFGKIKTSPEPIPSVYTVEPPQEGERRFEICRSGDLSRVWTGYHIPQADHEDTYALAAIRHVLGSTYERSSRLYRALIDTGLVADVFARHDELRDPGLFFIGAALNPGTSPQAVEKIIHGELEKLAKEPVTDAELQRAKSANLKGTILTKADPSSLAFLLGEAESKASWHWLMDYDSRFEAVTTDDIMNVAARYFVRSNRTTGYFNPQSQISGSPDETLDESLSAEDMSSDSMEADRSENLTDSVNESIKTCLKNLREPEVRDLGHKLVKAAVEESDLRTLLEPPPAAVKVKFPRKKKKGPTFEERVRVEKLPNGLTVLLMENPGTESVAVSVNVKGGRYFTYKEKSSLSEIVGELLPRGSKHYSKLELAEALEEMGIPGGMEFSVDNFRLGTASHIVASDFPRYLDLLSDVMRNPIFAQDELDKMKIEWSSRLVEGSNNTRAVALNGLRRSIYPSGHPFHEKNFSEQLGQLGTVQREDLVEVHRRLLSPKGTIIAVVGDIKADQALSEIKARFDDWEGDTPGEIVIPQVDLIPGRRFLEMHLEDKSSADILISHPTTLRRDSADFYAARMANAAIGQDTITSRLGQVVRDRAGLTYGINSMFSDTAFGGAPWSITLTTNPTNIDKAIYLVDRVMNEFMEGGISPEELSRESGRAVGAFKVGLASSVGISRVLAELEFLGLGASELDTVSESYLSVTKDDADRAMRKYFHPDCSTTAIAGTLN